MICDLLWQNREQVGAKSFSLSRNQQCRLFLSDTITPERAFLSGSCGTPFQWQQLTLTIKKGVAHERTSAMLCGIVFGWTHRVVPILVMNTIHCVQVQVIMSNILSSDLFPVKPEQVTYMFTPYVTWRTISVTFKRCRKMGILWRVANQFLTAYYAFYGIGLLYKKKNDAS